MENAAAEGSEVLQSAVGVRALDSGDTSAGVAAGEQPLHRLGDPLEAELPELLGDKAIVYYLVLARTGSGSTGTGVTDREIDLMGESLEARSE